MADYLLRRKNRLRLLRIVTFSGDEFVESRRNQHVPFFYINGQISLSDGNGREKIAMVLTLASAAKNIFRVLRTLCNFGTERSLGRV